MRGIDRRSPPSRRDRAAGRLGDRAAGARWSRSRPGTRPGSPGRYGRARSASPSCARCRPSGASSISAAPEARLGLGQASAARISPVGSVTVTCGSASESVCRSTTRLRPSACAVSASSSSSGSLHQPVQQAAQQRGVRAAALIAARPQPGLVGEEHGDAAFALVRKHEQRPAARAGHGDVAGDGVGVDQPEPLAPGRRVARSARAGRASPDGAARPG